MQEDNIEKGRLSSKSVNVENVVTGVELPGETVLNYDRMAVYGESGLNRWGNNVFEELLPQLRWPTAARVYKEMSDNDPVIGAIILMSKQLLKNAEWTVTIKGESPEAEAARLFVEQCKDDMERPWNDFISEALSMIIYGWSFHEINYKVRKGPREKKREHRSKYRDGKIGWRGMPIRSQSTLQGWIYDKDSYLLAMEQLAPPHFKKSVIPLTKAVLFNTECNRENPEGRSMLRNAYRPWHFKKKIEEIEGVGIERDLAGLPVIIPAENVDLWNADNPESVAKLAMAESIVRNVRRDNSEGLVIPFGWEFKLVSTGGTRQFDTNEIINRYNHLIAITMLADIVVLGADKIGSLALADVKKSLLASALEALADNIASTLNSQVIPPLMEINGWGDLEDYPVFEVSDIETPSLKELAEFFRYTGMKVDDDFELYNFLRKSASLPIIDEVAFNEIQARKDEARKITDAASNSHSDVGETPKRDNIHPKNPSLNRKEVKDDEA